MSSTTEPPKKQLKMDNDNGNVDNDGNLDYDEKTQTALEEIDACQNDIDALNEKASEEILHVEQKYNKLRKPHYDARNDVISKIPKFWLICFVNHPQISSILDDKEEDCLNYLSQVDVEEFEDIKSGYRVKFHFNSNPYLSNSILTKEFHLALTGDPASESTTIKWKADMDLVAEAEAKQKSAGQETDGYNRTFFQWFNDNSDPAADDIAEVIKDDLWPNPLQYFLAADIEVDENGVSSDYDENADDSVVIDGDDDLDGVEELDGDDGEA